VPAARLFRTGQAGPYSGAGELGLKREIGAASPLLRLLLWGRVRNPRPPHLVLRAKAGDEKAKGPGAICTAKFRGCQSRGALLGPFPGCGFLKYFTQENGPGVSFWQHQLPRLLRARFWVQHL